MFSHSINRSNSWEIQILIHQRTDRNIQERVILDSTKGGTKKSRNSHFFGQEPSAPPKEPETRDETHLLTQSQSLKKPQVAENPPILARGEQEPDPRSRLGLEQGEGSRVRTWSCSMGNGPCSTSSCSAAAAFCCCCAADDMAFFLLSSLTSALFEANWRAARENRRDDLLDWSSCQWTAACV